LIASAFALSILLSLLLLILLYREAKCSAALAYFRDSVTPISTFVGLIDMYNNMCEMQLCQSLVLRSVDPTRVVLYTLAESGYVGFYDPDAVLNDDLYFVARSLRPVAVAYDPVDKVNRLLSLSTDNFRDRAFACRANVMFS